ncbi:DEAD/DEAH box helicase [Haliangium sp.]|uniref:DEAD/DEAH box helicase n=1 Tax=Haliangium sp. TaxID=2663208 RepID=UPI003D10746D
MQFDQLRLAEPLLRAVRGAGYSTATPIQVQAIPPVLDGYDLLGCAQTGTGKTAAFSLPILQILAAEVPPGRRPIRALIVTPTRELAAQIGDSLRTYGRHLPLRSAVIFGGVGQGPQVDALRRGIDILVATPGRLLDLIDQGHVRLGEAEILVLDEADRMLDMGFIRDIRRIIAELPAREQTLLFSATMPDEIRALAAGILDEPVEVAVTPQATTAETVEQWVYLVERADKQALLTHLLRDDALAKALIFTRTKHGADRVAKKLNRSSIEAMAIHGNKSQNARLRALDSFKRGRTRVLVASDIAARGLDIDEVTHVINFDLPNEPETYVHRIGRTGRAGASGIALSFCANEERTYLRDIERTVEQDLAVIADHPFHAGFEKLPRERPAPRPKPSRSSRRRRPRGRPGGGSRQSSGGGQR